MPERHLGCAAIGARAFDLVVRTGRLPVGAAAEWMGAAGATPARSTS